MKIIQRAVAVGALATTLVGGTALLAPGAGAAGRTTPPASASADRSPVPVPAAKTQAQYNGACGAGYTVVNSAEVGTVGTVFLTYSTKTGDNCVVTVRTKPAAAIWMVASLKISGAATGISDSDYYRSYAGPVPLHAAGKCVTWYGVIGTARGGKTRTNCGTYAAVQG
jgi:hypothetical protein